MIDLHQGKARYIGRTAALLLVIAVIVLMAFTIRDADDDAVSPAETTEAENPEQALCEEAFAHQQPALELKPVNNDKSETLTLDSLVGVGTLPGGICVDTATEFYEEGWRINTIHLEVSAVTTGPNASEPITFSRDSNLETEYLPLYAPLPGCVTVRAVVQAVEYRAAPGEHAGVQYATWTAEGTYGHDCKDSPANAV